MVHVLKCWPEFFQSLLDGVKTFEIRLNDRGYRVGDYLLLREYDPIALKYTDRKTTRRVTYITHYAQVDQHVVMAIRELTEEERARHRDWEG